MPSISACIISFNEERKIEDCLASLEGVVDEVVLVDSVSTDRTLEIARPYVDKLIEQPFLGHIEQKNLAISHASHDWVLCLDCDERLTPELKHAILARKDTLDEHPGYEFSRKTFYVYRWLEHAWYPEFRTRLFDRRRGRWAGTNPHDKVELDGTQPARLSGDLLHYSFDSVGDHIKTLDHFTEIAARELIEKDKRVTWLSPITRASWVFFKLYILKRGFLDGFAGLSVAVLSFTHVFAKYAKLLTHRYQLERGLEPTAVRERGSAR